MDTPDQSSNAEVFTVLAGLVSSVNADAAEAFRSIAQTAAAAKAVECARSGDYRGYYFALPYPVKKIMSGLLDYAIPYSPEARFILMHQNFLEAHFLKIIRQYEGLSCCADKTGTILQRLMRYYLTGELIVFDKNAEYTFHHPQKVFTTHAAIVDFFKSLEALYYGQPEKYLESLKSVLATGAPIQE